MTDTVKFSRGIRCGSWRGVQIHEATQGGVDGFCFDIGDTVFFYSDVLEMLVYIENWYRNTKTVLQAVTE